MLLSFNFFYASQNSVIQRLMNREITYDKSKKLNKISNQ